MIVNSVGLFVDYENIYISLANLESRTLNHEVLARRLIDLAKAYGELTHMIAWADWDRFPGAQRVFATSRFDTKFVPSNAAGKNSADMAMQAEILKSLARDSSPEIFVIATGDRDFIFTVDELKRSGRQVVLAGVDEATSMDLKRVAHQFAPISYSTAPVDDPYSAVATSDPDGGFREGATFGDGRAPGEVLERIRNGLVELLAERHLPWISYRLFANHLIATDVAAPELVHRWIEMAVSEGYILREEERGAVKRFCKFMPSRRSAGLEVKSSEPTIGLPVSRGAAANQTALPRWPESRSQGTETGRPAPLRGAGWNQDWRNFTFVKIAWAVQNVLADKPPRFYINPSTLLDVLRNDGIGYSEEEVFFWVNQSVDKGVLTREVKDGGVPGAQRFYRYYLNQNNRLVMLAEQVPRAILQTVDSVLVKRSEWNGIAFNFLIKLLQVHPRLANPTYEFEPYRLREWINFLIDEQILMKFEEPDIKEPTRTTTMVGIVRDHPQTRRLLPETSSAQIYSPEYQALLRTILTIDHFLHWLRTKSPDEDWLPLMTLKSWQRASLGDQLTKWAVAECERENIFTIQRFQNKGGVEATVAGVRLEYSHPLVERVLTRRDEFLRMLIGLLRNRAVVPYSLLEQRLREHEGFGETPEERLSWLPLMADCKVITFERDGAAGEEASRGFMCRLNAREKFVGELLTRVIREGQGKTRSAGTDEPRMNAASEVESTGSDWVAEHPVAGGSPGEAGTPSMMEAGSASSATSRDPELSPDKQWPRE